MLKENSMEILRKFRDRKLIQAVSKSIEKIAKKLDYVRIMHVCGTHEHTITFFGLRSLLPDNVELIAGPGCPVCIVPAREVDEAIEIVFSGIRVYTYGDMYRVPGTKMSLADARSEGADVKVVYGFNDAIRLHMKDRKKSVFFAVGFETTAPTLAAFISRRLIPDDLMILPSFRLTVPIMKYILSSFDINIDGIICPGHVSTIVGASAWSFIPRISGIPAVVAGFEPLDVMLAVFSILKMILEGKPRLVNEYSRAVSWRGNITAKRYVREVFYRADGEWRGIGRVKRSRLLLRKRFKHLDARSRLSVSVDTGPEFKPGCRCADIILGKAKPTDCPLFMRACTPDRPQGPCMVSSEGTCSIWAKYGGYERIQWHYD